MIIFNNIMRWVVILLIIFLIFNKKKNTLQK